MADTRAWRTGLRVWAAAATMGGAHAGFVGEKSSGDSVSGGHHDTGSCQAPRNGTDLSESAFEDDGKGLPQERAVDEQNHEAAHHIEEGHKRNQLFAYPGDGFHASENNQAGNASRDKSNCKTDGPGVCSQKALKTFGAGHNDRGHIAVYYARNGVDLYAASYAEGCEGSQDSEGNAQPSHA